jgi:hypothetical protein
MPEEPGMDKPATGETDPSMNTSTEEMPQTPAEEDGNATPTTDTATGAPDQVAEPPPQEEPPADVPAVSDPVIVVESPDDAAMAAESGDPPSAMDDACSAESLSTVSPANAGFTDTLYLRSDEDVSNFAALGCASLPGTLFVSGDQITSLAGLEVLERIEGSLVFEALTNLVDLKGLDGLKRIDEDLAIRSSELDSLDGLEQLEFLGGTLELESTDFRSLAVFEDVQFGMGDLILDSTGLESLAGLESLTYRKNVVITGSRNLETLSGLNNLAHVDGDLTVKVNKTLTSLVGLNALRTVGGALAVEWNDSLQTLDGLGALTQVNEGSIASNQVLTSTAALSGVTSVNDLSIADNAILSQAVLPAVRSIDGRLSVEANGSATSDPLVISCPVLETAGSAEDYETGVSVASNGNLSVIDMPAMQWANSIDVHENEGTFSAEMPALHDAEMVGFWKNPGLWTIHSLPSLTELGTSITIHTNDNLPSCELDEILFRLGECDECQANTCSPH